MKRYPYAARNSFVHVPKDGDSDERHIAVAGDIVGRLPEV
jgi:hypothetical protein